VVMLSTFGYEQGESLVDMKILMKF